MPSPTINLLLNASGAIGVVAVGAALVAIARRRGQSAWSLGWVDLPSTLKAIVITLLLAQSFLLFVRIGKQYVEAQRRYHLAEYSVDLDHYYQASRSVTHGEMPWRDFFFEYPPAAAYLVAPPGMRNPEATRSEYGNAFTLYIVGVLTLGTVVLGGLWLRFGRIAGVGLALTAWTYGLAFLGELIYMRMEPIIAILTIAGLTALLLPSPRNSEGDSLSRTRVLLAGLFLGLAAAKLYALFLALALIPAVFARKRLGAFATGLAVGLIPSILPALLGPANAGKFLGYHGLRHFEIGSLYAVLSQGAAGGRTDVAFGSYEWRFASEGLLGKIATVFTLLATLGPLALVYLRRRTDLASGFWAGAASLAGFVLFNKVGSPQYAIWLLSVVICGALLTRGTFRGALPWLATILLAFGFTQTSRMQMQNFTPDRDLARTFQYLGLKLEAEVFVALAIFVAFAITLRRTDNHSAEEIATSRKPAAP